MQNVPAILALTITSGCATLPSSGPTGAQVVSESDDRSRFPAHLIELNAATLANANAPVLQVERLARLAAQGEIDRIGAGDMLQISVFEIGTSLFAGSVAVGGNRNAAAGSALPPMVVARDGTITVPYVGRVRAQGVTPADLETEIEKRFKHQHLSEDAQVSVSVLENRANVAFMMGAVKAPGRMPISLAREHVLDAIALAGGATAGPEAITVRVTRSGMAGEIGLDELRSGSSDDLLLLPGDRIELVSAMQTFTVFGAADKVSEIPFGRRTLTLTQAIARAGGPTDHQADATAVFVFRWDTPKAGMPDAPPSPLIYRLNLMQPESYFVAQHFAMRNGDVIYIANARSNQAIKLVQVINQLFSPFYGIRQLTQ